MVIDTHSHYMPPTVARNTMFFKAGWSDLDHQLAVMDSAGIEKALLLYPTSDAHLNMGGWGPVVEAFNSGIAEAVRKHPDRLMGAGIVPVDAPSDIPVSLSRVKEEGLVALSMASSYAGRYLDDEMFDAVFEFARDNRMPIHVHPQILNPIGEERLKDPLLSPVLEYVFDVSACIGRMMMNGTFRKFPDVNIIFAHYGGVLPVVKERFDNTYQMLRKRDFVKDLQKLPGEYFKRLYFDTSGSRSLGSLMCALEITDAEHILWGSDFPANQDIPGSIETVRRSSLPEDQRQAILGKNFLNLFNG